MSRGKGGKKNVKNQRGRIVVIPLWKKEPDLRLFAQAVISLAEQQRQESLEASNEAEMGTPESKEVEGD
jgi:hypothetical protein